MDTAVIPTHLWAVALGWFIRHLAEKPQEERPCQCHCRCSCVSEGGAFLALVALCFGGFIWWWLSRKEVPAVVSPKDKKGVWGVSGKVLSLTG